jgi:hypothetical protein
MDEQLKPKCIELSQLALRDDGSASNAKSLILSTTQLLDVLERKCRRTDGVFDEKLADYVFFPLSQILRGKQSYTGRLTELTIKCMTVLLEYGWRKSIALDLGKQLLILLTFVAGGVPGKDTAPAPEELMVEAYRALAALFRDLAVTPGGPTSLVESGSIPALGHCVTVILDGVTKGPSAEAQLQALNTLESVWRCIKDPEALSSFLPGTISGLTKCLTPETGARRTRKTIIKALEVMELVLTSTLSDIRTRSIRNQSDEVSTGNTEQRTLTKPWLKATAGQIKLALSNVIRLRSHESVEVRKALNRLCVTILDECHDTLAEAASMLVETCMTLTGVDDEESMRDRATTLVDLASIHPDLGDLIKSTIYNWVTSLPRVMQSNDETAKVSALGQLSKAHGLLTGLNLESSILEDALSNSLRDAVTVTLESLPAPKALQEEGFDMNSQAAMTLATENAITTQFRPIVMPEESQKQTRTQLNALLAHLGTRQAQIKMASEMLEYAQDASGPSLLSAYWLSSQIVKSAASSNQDLDDFFESSLTFSDEQEAINQELFSYSLSVLSSPYDGNSDWRIQAISLEVVAETAQRMKQAFRAELVDTLYPVAQLLGSPNSKLREHAITCLNIISKSCGYTTASELIVDNVDYMVNAISLRLNTFDVSPQAPQVLVMMIRLTGPSLLLYLDDVVGSIFAALDNFHGYHRLVEVLFSVLGEIVSVGSKSNQLQITSSPIITISHRKTAHPIPTISDIITLLSKKSSSESDTLPHEDFPRAPWKSAKTLLDEAEAPPPEEAEQEEPSTEIEKPPPTKTHEMLTSIARLSQHYLTSSSPVLRSKLLNLITTSSSALYTDEDAFLPLVNDIWPVVIARLYDSEPFVQISACQTISKLCECAGDFLSSRISDEWSGIIKLVRQSRTRVEAEKKRVYSQNSQVWEAVVGLLMGIVGYVGIGDECFDEVLEVLGRLVWERESVRGVLEGVNADAVWLVMFEAGRIEKEKLETPVMEGWRFTELREGVLA